MPETAPADDDEALYERFIAGDNDACVVLFKRHNQRLFTYCLKLVGDPPQAEDLAQEVWGRLIEFRSSGRPLHNPIGFLVRMARNLCLDYLKSRRKLMALDGLNESSHPTYSLPELSEKEELILISMQKLPEDYRDVLILNIYCGYTFEEIAVILGKSPEAIWTRASRARSQLRKIVRAAYDGQSPLSANDSKIGGPKK
jgi:RNA polymerase sigma-70 factor (ECF subfamily)